MLPLPTALAKSIWYNVPFPHRVNEYELSSGFNDSCLTIMEWQPQTFANSNRSFIFPRKNAKGSEMVIREHKTTKVTPKLSSKDIFLLCYLPPQ